MLIISRAIAGIGAAGIFSMVRINESMVNVMILMLFIRRCLLSFPTLFLWKREDNIKGKCAY
jgi:hypothetical protein